MKGITLCADCAYYSMKKHRCIRGATDDSDPRARFFADCPLPDVVPVNHGRWIPVTERMPDIDELVIAYDKREGYMCSAMFRGHDWMMCGGYVVDDDEFTHWMPLPEPPGEEE